MRRAVLITRQAISPRLATRILVNAHGLHPEHAERVGGNRRVERRRQCEAERPGVAPGSMMPSSHSRAVRVVGMALRFVLGADGCLELGLSCAGQVLPRAASCRRAGRWPARWRPARRPSPIPGRSARSTEGAGCRRGRTCRSCRRRTSRRSDDVNLGTAAVDTAVTILAPSWRCRRFRTCDRP